MSDLIAPLENQLCKLCGLAVEPTHVCSPSPKALDEDERLARMAAGEALL